MVKNIAVFSSISFTNLLVVKALSDAGFNVSVMDTDTANAKNIYPENTNIVEGNARYHYDLKRFLATQDAVYCSFNTGMEDENDYHNETDLLREIINASLESGIKRIALHSSIVQNYQGENGFDWWAFDIKNEAVNYVRDCGIPFTILNTSSFMESIVHGHLKGKVIQIFGEASFPQYYISAQDYANMLISSFKKLGTEDREYNIQGLNCYKPVEAATIFTRNYTKEKLRIKVLNMAWVKFRAFFSKRMQYNANLMTAINNYNEIFNGEQAWAEHGKPQITIAEYAKNLA